MKTKEFSVSGRLTLFENTVAPWTYLFVPFDKVPDVDPGGWGSIPVEVTLGESTWRTSIFPLKKDGYFLPIKKPILKKEGLKSGDRVKVNYSVFKNNTI